MRKLAIALAAAVSGCAGQPRYERPAVAPAPAFVSAVDTTFSPQTPVAAFWTQLGDTTLNRLIEAGLRGGLDLRAAEARVRGARAARQLSALDYFPTVTASGGYTRRRFSAAELPGIPPGFETDIWDAGLAASWELDVFGRIRRNVAGQSALEASAREDLRAVQVALAAEIGRTYFDLRGAQQQLAVAQRNAENQKHTLQLTQDRLDAGRGTAFDKERASALLSGTLATIPQLETRVASASFRLAVLLGQSPESLKETLALPGDLPTLPAQPQVGTPDQLIRQRPDVRSAERQAAAQHAFVGSAKAEYLPRFTVGGTAGLTATSFDSLGQSGASRFALGPVISWPLLNLGRVKSRVDIARARSDEASVAYNQTVLRALEETERSLVAYDRSGARLKHLQDAADASARAAELARLRFDGGVADFLQVLDAERTLLDDQNRLAQGRTDAVTAFVTLYQALGGEWPLVTETGR